MERGVTTYSVVFLLGIISAFLLPVNPLPLTATTPIFILLAYYTKKRTTLFLATTHLAIFVCGATGCTLAQQGESLPPDSITQAITLHASNLQKMAASHFLKFTRQPQEHATLCALTIGDKRYMTKELKRSFSAAGAMHVLALSGLHIGIAFAIIYKILAVLILFPGGHTARNLIALLFIVGYTILSGCSPSVVRAATMIFIYKIAAGKFRKIGSLEAIALAALITCIISPLQVLSIGFQLSYCAVLGIVLLYPTCKKSYMQISIGKRWNKGYAQKVTAWLWNTISLSVCCQIATLPVAIWHFGSWAPHFLLTNLAAIPLATAILYTLTATLILQHIPLIGDLSTRILQLLLHTLNSAVDFIAL